MPGQDKFNSLTSIVAIDVRGAIGCRNELPWRLKSDMAFFRAKTIDNTVIMGRKTYDSLGKKCLPRRNNVVLSHNNVLFPSSPQCRLALSIEEALFLAASFDDEEIFVIGGAQTYNQFAPLVDRYLVTVVDHEVADADAYLSQSILDDLRVWDRKEIGTYPAVATQDEFGFSVFEVLAPDPAARAAERARQVSAYRAKTESSKRPPRRSHRRFGQVQNAFAF